MSYFDRQPAMFDAKKRLGQGNNHEKASDEESWVELAPSRTSLCSSVEAVMVENVGETSNSKDSRLSPISVQSPHVEFEPNLEAVKYRLTKDMLPAGKNTDWIWDWSSRPEAQPPNKFHRRQIGSTLTTPPPSPEPETVSEYEYKLDKSTKSVFYRFEVIFGLVVSNIMSLVLGATIG
uniref:Uncharacterized protein n=1 Tax=Panagrolaimus sp. JU765 TaxID=591449 RepID=A0AC34QYT6_9BILA